MIIAEFAESSFIRIYYNKILFFLEKKSRDRSSSYESGRSLGRRVESNRISTKIWMPQINIDKCIARETLLVSNQIIAWITYLVFVELLYIRHDLGSYTHFARDLKPLQIIWKVVKNCLWTEKYK